MSFVMTQWQRAFFFNFSFHWNQWILNVYCRCFQETNCLEGEAKIVQNCTVTSPPVCDGCKDNYYFDPNAGGVGGCVECSRKCNAVEVEVVSCNTKHDRKCVRALATIEVVTSKFCIFSLSNHKETHRNSCPRTFLIVWMIKCLILTLKCLVDGLDTVIFHKEKFDANCHSTYIYLHYVWNLIWIKRKSGIKILSFSIP